MLGRISRSSGPGRGTIERFAKWFSATGSESTRSSDEPGFARRHDWDRSLLFRYDVLTREPMDETNRRAFAARYTEPSGRRWVAEEVARLETVAPSIDGPAPRLVLRFTSEDSLREQRFTRCGPLHWTSPEIIEALFLSARPIRVVTERTPPANPRRRADQRNRRGNGPP
jgi:hypothetical protein